MEDSNATISEVLANLQSIFSGVESLGKAVEFGDKVAVPIYQFNFGTGGGGGGGGREGRTNNAAAFGLGGTIGPVAIVILEKDVPGPNGIHIHEFKSNKLGEALAELMLRLWNMIESQMGKRTKLSAEKKEKLMNI
ncbi:MAG: spore germination protein GerW family protein [Halobacteriota archaeon]